MSDQSSTTTNTPAEPAPCTNGCGFFGNPATGNCCSKCWREAQQQKKNKGECETTTTAASAPSPMEICTPVEESTPASPSLSLAEKPAAVAAVETMSVVASVSAPAATVQVPAAPKVVKKKKKKTSYKAMMANMTKRTKDEQDIEKEKEGLRKVTGGGAFAKIDKI